MRINLGSKILTWLNSFVLLQTDICIFVLSLLIVSATCTVFKAQDAPACSKCDRFSQPEDLMFLPPLLVDFLLLFLRSRFMIFDCPTREKRVSIIIRL